MSEAFFCGTSNALSFCRFLKWYSIYEYAVACPNSKLELTSCQSASRMAHRHRVHQQEPRSSAQARYQAFLPSHWSLLGCQRYQPGKFHRLSLSLGNNIWGAYHAYHDRVHKHSIICRNTKLHQVRRRRMTPFSLSTTIDDWSPSWAQKIPQRRFDLSQEKFFANIRHPGSLGWH